MKKIMTACALVLSLTIPVAASAHTLWINLYESFSHKPGHISSSLGWGHVVPMDDVFEKFDLASYTLVDPAMNKTELSLPAPSKKLPNAGAAEKQLRIVSGDMGVHKMTLQDDAMQGTYQIVATSKENFYSTYIDLKGRNKWAHTTMDKLGKVKKVLRGMKFATYAKAFFAVGEWTQPKPQGFDLELMPLTDLSDVRVGDRVEFEARIMGKPLNTMPEKNFEYMTLTSNTFGGPDGFMLASLIFNGKADFRMPTAGQWVVNVYTRQEVTPDGPLKEMVGKCTNALYAATISFNVKP